MYIWISNTEIYHIISTLLLSEVKKKSKDLNTVCQNDVKSSLPKTF